jgi:hypothetical protein
LVLLLLLSCSCSCVALWFAVSLLAVRGRLFVLFAASCVLVSERVRLRDATVLESVASLIVVVVVVVVVGSSNCMVVAWSVLSEQIRDAGNERYSAA